MPTKAVIQKEKKEYNMNPQIQSFTIGIQKMREVTVFPLSLADQIKLTDEIQNVLASWFDLQEKKKKESGEEEQALEFATFII